MCHEENCGTEKENLQVLETCRYDLDRTSVASARPLERLRFAADAAVCGSLLGIDELLRVLHRPWPLRSPHLHVGRRTTPRNTSAASAAAAWQTARLLTISELERSCETCFEAVCARARLPNRRV